jgi:hypothetical protein
MDFGRRRRTKSVRDHFKQWWCKGDPRCASRAACGGRRSQVGPTWYLAAYVDLWTLNPKVDRSFCGLIVASLVWINVVFFYLQLAHSSVPKLVFASVRSSVLLPEFVRPIQDLLFARLHHRSFWSTAPPSGAKEKGARLCRPRFHTRPATQPVILPLVPAEVLTAA